MDRGAHFHNCDLQVHTPRDVNWQGPRPTSPADRKAYAEEFVAACRSKRLDAVAITDHHDFAFFEYIRTAAEEETDSEGKRLSPEHRLVVFPGLELTLAVPCQALLILDADFPLDRLDNVLVCLSIECSDPTLAIANPPKRLPQQDFKQLYDELDRNPWLKGHYIAFPNVTDSGHETLMRSGMSEKYKSMPCVGGYVDGGTKIGAGNRRIFDGKDPAYGNRRLAVIYTSDSRSSTHEQTGKHTTWIKWATPTAEALRQACLAAESRISHKSPELPAARLTRLSVSNSWFLGPIELELNPQYNAIIGGRGTGKSTLLEYLRWALCDQPSTYSPGDEISDPAARRARLVTETLTALDALVDVHFLLNGIPHILRRRARSDEAQLRVAERDFEPITHGDVRALLPIQAYSQRQLSSVAVRLDEVLRFITNPVKRELDDLSSEQAELEAKMRENFGALQRQRALDAQIRREEVDLRSIIEQATALREQLTAISPEDQQLLREKPAYDTANDFVQSRMRRIADLQEDVRSFAEAVARELAPPTTDPAAAPAAQDAVRSVDDAVGQVLQQVQRDAQALRQSLERSVESGQPIAAALERWRAAYTDFQSRYEAAKQRSAVHESQLTELAGLETRRGATAGALAQHREEVSRIGDSVSQHQILRGEWVALQVKRSDILAKQCDSLTELSGGSIRARLEPRANLSEVTDRLRRAASGSGIRATQIEAVIAHLAATQDPLASWLETLDSLEEQVLAGSNPTVAKPPPVRGALQAILLRDVQRIVGKLTPDSILALSLTPVGDRPIFEYRTKVGEYIPFEKASPGQQATALLKVLLAQLGPPLIIDQPEDDLDSQVVLEVVEQLWTAKSKRQLLYASHNANLVVNGDAELVISCDYRAAGDQSGGQIKLQGAIDVPPVRSEIAAVMEGGERAFRMRQEKYGF